MSPGRRLAVEVSDGRVTVVDRDRPGARLLEIVIPGGGSAMVAQHLCGWAAPGGEPLWTTVPDAVAALGGHLRDGQPWIAVLEEYAAGLGRPDGGAP